MYNVFKEKQGLRDLAARFSRNAVGSIISKHQNIYWLPINNEALPISLLKKIAGFFIAY